MCPSHTCIKTRTYTHTCIQYQSKPWNHRAFDVVEAVDAQQDLPAGEGGGELLDARVHGGALQNPQDVVRVDPDGEHACMELDSEGGGGSVR